MRQGIRLQSPALIISLVALFAALGGTVYAAKHKKMNGKAIRVKSLPGNRVKLHSIPANRLKPNVLHGMQLKGPLTGADINEFTLGQVPSATHAETADAAQSAVDAQTSLNAVNAINADTVNGHSAGCQIGTVSFAGACWETSARDETTAPAAAAACASAGGALPEALQLAAFANETNVSLDTNGEWSSDLWNYSAGPYAVATVLPSGAMDSGLVQPGGAGSESRAYRCVIPLVR
jgi:hypothetical protein